MTQQTESAVGAPSPNRPQAGRHDEPARVFSPRSLRSSEHVEDSDQPQIVVPIGRPIPDSVYQREKEAALTEPSGDREPAGQADRSL